MYFSGFSFNNGGYLYNCESCTTFTIGTSGINELNPDLALNVFPNPVSELLTINSDTEIHSIETFDLLGKKINSEIISSPAEHYEKNIQELKNGIYFLKVTTVKGAGVRKFIKQ